MPPVPAALFTEREKMNFDEFISRYGIKLNHAQCAAAQAVDGATLLVAVPGSGKTTVLVARLGYMVIGLGIDPSSVLTMTYTVAATKDMKNRFCSFFGEEWRGAVEFRTINGVCARIIRSFERMTGRRAFELVADEKESTAFLSAICKEHMGSYPTENDIQTVRTQITYAKNMMLTDVEIKALEKKTGLPIFDIYRSYNEVMREQRRMDYDDQMVYAYRILRKYPAVLRAAQNAYRYICVDEAQDTSRIQHEIIRLLVGKSGNLFMVGDEDQSIYGFRAAYPEALLDFEKNYPGARVLLMEENFRSDANIVSMADRFIRKNLHRHEKNMYAFRPPRNDVREIMLSSRSAQYDYFLNLALNCGKETAVLYRENECALPLIDLLERQGVPYRLRMRDMTFFTHRVIQDIVAIIRFAYDPYDTELFMQIYYKLSTYLRREDASALCAISKAQGISVLDALDVAEGISGGAMKAVRSVQTHLWKLQSDRADRAIWRIEDLMGYGDYLDRIGSKKAKLAILQGIGRNEPSAAHLIKRLETLSEIICDKPSDDSAKFILSTIHSAKGLEYDTVFLIDAVDRVLPENVIENPKTATVQDIEQYEEERRLFYVAVTRAKNHLCILTYKDADSCFCDEFLQKNADAVMAKLPKANTGEDYLSFCGKYGQGARITHKKYGKGKVISSEAGMILVRFDDGSLRRFSLAVLYEKSLTE